MANKLFLSGELTEWRAALSCYNSVIATLANKKKKSELLELDTWYQETLPTAIKKRDTNFISKEELEKIVKWKLTRGKFRPRLTQLAASNDDDLVITCSRKASEMGDSACALAELCKLKGVGPATASALLCAMNPDKYPFMADESVYAVFNHKNIKYTAKEYKEYSEQVREKSSALTKKDKTKKWTAHDVEKALWSKTHELMLNLNDENVAISKKRLSNDGNIKSTGNKKSRMDK